MESQCQAQIFALEMPFGQVENCSLLNPVFVSGKYLFKEQLSGGQRPNLSEFINGRSFLLWEVMKMDHSHLDWMSRDVEFWEQDENYMKLFEGVNNFTIVNDPSERVVQLAEKRIKSVRSETRFQDTLLSVHELYLLCHGIKRDSFDKRELQIIVKKMMMKE